MSTNTQTALTLGGDVGASTRRFARHYVEMVVAMFLRNEYTRAHAHGAREVATA